MENTLLIGLSRQMALGRELDVIANNLANLNTTGFKAEGAVFEQYLMPGARQNEFSGTDSRLSFVQDRSTWHDFNQGTVEQTGNPLDVAIDGNAFLTVQTPRGERYTKNGSMQINSQGQLVSSDGNPVLGDNGPIVFQPGDRNISISKDGRVSVVEGANSRTESLRGKLRLVTFADPQRLQKDGSSTFLAPAGVAPQPATTASVNQGSIEKSNVRSMIEMTRMIELTRTYTQIAQILQNHSDLRKSAISQLAEVPS